MALHRVRTVLMVDPGRFGDVGGEWVRLVSVAVAGEEHRSLLARDDPGAAVSPGALVIVERLWPAEVPELVGVEVLGHDFLQRVSRLFSLSSREASAASRSA